MPQNVGSDQSLNFQPSTFTVVVGVNNTITFVDQDSQSGAPHDVHWTSQPAGANAPNSPSLMTPTTNSTWTVTLTTPGSYSFVCQYHSGWMKGTITVKTS